MSARSEQLSWWVLFKVVIRLTPKILRDSSQNAPEFVERVTDLEPIVVDAELADSIFVCAGPLLKHGYGAPHLASRLKIAQQQDGIGEIGHVDGRPHLADHSMLSNR